MSESGPSPSAARRPWAWEVAGLLLVLAVGAALRLAALDRLPPGLWQDEAWEAVDAQAILSGARPAFLPENNGREPLFAYAMAAVFAVAGPTPEAVRATGALLGLLTLPVTWLWVRSWFGPRVALLATAYLAVLYWHVHVSRLGLRPVALPLFLALALWLLRLALAGRVWAAPLAGAAVGLSWYTYLPARLFPAVVLAYVGLWWLSGRGRACAAEGAGRPPARRKLPIGPLVGGGLFLAGLGLALAPLGGYFLAHPEDFVGRGAQVSVMRAVDAGADPLQVLGENLRANLGEFFLAGDRNPRHNLPGRPIFDPLSAALAAFGLARAASGTRARASGTIRLSPEHGAVLIALPVMVVPGLISDSAPHFLRSIGLLPALVVLPALGLDALVAALTKRGAAVLGGAVALGALALAGGLAARDYFVVLPTVADLGPAFQTTNRALAARAATYPAEVAVYAGPVRFDDPTVRFLAPRPVRTFDETVLPLADPARGPAAYLLAPDQADRLEQLARFRPGGRAIRTSDLLVFELDSGPTQDPRPGLERPARFDEAIELLGLDPPAPARAGQSLDLTLYWRAAARPGGDYVVFVRLVAPSGRTAAEVQTGPGRRSYPTGRWAPGELIVDHLSLPLPADLLPGAYRLVLGLDRPEGRRAEAIGPAGPIPAGELELGEAVVQPPATPPDPARLRIARRADLPLRDPWTGRDALRFLGATPSAERARAGDFLDLTLFWQSLGAAHPDYVTALRLVSADGRVVAEQAWPITGGQHPAPSWTAGELIREDLRLRVPPTTPAGRYTVLAEVSIAGGAALQTPTGERALAVGVLEVAQRAYLTEPPPIARPRAARFGDVAELLGYDVSPAAPRSGDRLTLTLYWRALGETGTSYKVFTHLIDTGGQVRAQKDAPPRDGELPTTLWVPGEVIVDPYEIALDRNVPAGEYVLEVGMYDGATGERLPAFDPAGTRLDQDRLVLERLQVGPGG